MYRALSERIDRPFGWTHLHRCLRWARSNVYSEAPQTSSAVPASLLDFFTVIVRTNGYASIDLGGLGLVRTTRSLGLSHILTTRLPWGAKCLVISRNINVFIPSHVD